MLTREQLHPYQETAVKHILDNTHGALFLEMGLGKTVSTLTAIKTLIYDYLDISNVLVIAPKFVAENVWDAEIEKWEHLKDLTISKVTGNERKRKIALQKKADIYIIGRDNVAWLCGLYGGSMLPFDMLVIDELSSFKNPQSVRFKSLKLAQPSFFRVVGLTGTPAPNSLIDIWSQIYLLDRGKRLGKFITHFRAKYFKNISRSNAYSKYVLNSFGEEQITKLIGDICMSMKAKDFLDLPDRIDNHIKIKMPEDILKKYEDFEREKVLELFEESEEGITVANAAALSNKLLQFANGAVYDEEKNVHEVHNLKIDAIKEIIEDANGKPVLIAWTYRSDMQRLLESLKKHKPREMKSSQDIVDWNEGRIKVMLMHPASGGHGLNLQYGGNIIVWFGQTWSLELEQQFNARLHRQGQKKVVTIHKLILDNTIDKDVIEAQNRKSKNQEALMQAVKLRIDKYLV